MKFTEGARKEPGNTTEWMKVNKLSPNPKKTEFIIIGHPPSTRKLPETLEPNSSEIKRVEKTKYLGIIIDGNLNWDEQFKQIRSKINTGLMSLKWLKKILPQSQLCCVYYSYLYDFCCFLFLKNQLLCEGSSLVDSHSIALNDKKPANMAAETVTDMKGNVVKMEADFSQSVDKMLPECEGLVKVSF